jgi:hypothetical protein
MADGKSVRVFSAFLFVDDLIARPDPHLWGFQRTDEHIASAQKPLSSTLCDDLPGIFHCAAD